MEKKKVSRQRECDRRKDICIECGRLMPIKAKDMCQNCWHKFKRKNEPNFFLRTRYTELKQRCTNPKERNIDTYLGLSYCTLNEFLNRFLKDKHFNKLFKNWQKSNFEYKLCPSIDRINPKFGYTLDNIQFLTHSENCTKDQKKCPVNVFKNGKFIIKIESTCEAARKFNLEQANVWKVLNKERTHTGGYYFEYA